MSNYEPTNPGEILPSDPESGKPPETNRSRRLQNGGNCSIASSHHPSPSSDWPISATMTGQRSRPTMRGHLSHLRRGLIAAAALIGSVTGLFIGLGAS